MTQPDIDVSVWWAETPLQGRFLGNIYGGEFFYEHIKKLLREPAPSEAALTCYKRMLTLGYQGKYLYEGGEENDERQSLLKQLPYHPQLNPKSLNLIIFTLATNDDFTEYQRKHYVKIINSFVPKEMPLSDKS